MEMFLSIMPATRPMLISRNWLSTLKRERQCQPIRVEVRQCRYLHLIWQVILSTLTLELQFANAHLFIQRKNIRGIVHKQRQFAPLIKLAQLHESIAHYFWIRLENVNYHLVTFQPPFWLLFDYFLTTFWLFLTPFDSFWLLFVYF